MTLNEFAYTASALGGFVVLRIGVPLLALWALNRVCCRTFHLSTS